MIGYKTFFYITLITVCDGLAFQCVCHKKGNACFGLTLTTVLHESNRSKQVTEDLFLFIFNSLF